MSFAHRFQDLSGLRSRLEELRVGTPGPRERGPASGGEGGRGRGEERRAGRSVGARSESADRATSTEPFPRLSYELLHGLPLRGDGTAADPSQWGGQPTFPPRLTEEQIHAYVRAGLPGRGVANFMAVQAGATTEQDASGGLVPTSIRRVVDQRVVAPGGNVNTASRGQERPFNPPTEPRAMREARERRNTVVNSQTPTHRNHGRQPSIPSRRPPRSNLARESHAEASRSTPPQPPVNGSHHTQRRVQPESPVSVAQLAPSSQHTELYARYGAPPPKPDFSNSPATVPTFSSSLMTPRPLRSGQSAQTLNLRVSGPSNTEIPPGPTSSPLPPTDRGVLHHPSQATPPTETWFHPPRLHSALTWGPGQQTRPGLFLPAPESQPLAPPQSIFAQHGRTPSSIATASGSQYSLPTPPSYPTDRSSGSGPVSRNSRPPARNRQAARYARELHRQEDLAALTAAHERLAAATSMQAPPSHPMATSMQGPPLYHTPMTNYPPLPSANPFAAGPAPYGAGPAQHAAGVNTGVRSDHRFAARPTSGTGQGTLFVGGTSHGAGPSGPSSAAPTNTSDAALTTSMAQLTFGSHPAVPSRQPHHTRSTPNLGPATQHEAWQAHRQEVLAQLRAEQIGQDEARAAAAARGPAAPPSTSREPSNLSALSEPTGPPAAQPTAFGGYLPRPAPATQTTTRPVPPAPAGPTPSARTTTRAPLAPIGAERASLRATASSSSLMVPPTGEDGDGDDDDVVASMMGRGPSFHQRSNTMTHGHSFHGEGLAMRETSHHGGSTMMHRPSSSFSSAPMTRRSREVLVAALHRTASENATDPDGNRRSFTSEQ